MLNRIFEALFARTIIWTRALFELDDIVGTRCENCAEVILRNHWGMPYPVCRGCFDAMWHSKDHDARYAFFMLEHPRALPIWKRRIEANIGVAAEDALKEEREAALDYQAQVGRKILASETDGIPELMQHVKGHLLGAGLIERAIREGKEEAKREGQS